MTLLFAGWAMTGAVVSCTVTVKLPMVVLLFESVAEQLIVVVPSGKTLPDAGVHVTGRELSTISKAEDAKVTAVPEALVASAVIFAGRVNSGPVVSCTVTVKLSLAVLP